MNKQELIEIIIKNIDDIGAYAMGVDTLLAQGILGLRNQVNGLKEQLHEPIREECKILRTPQDIEDNTMTCSKCDFHGIGEIIMKYCNYCPNCGSKIKRR